jgi:fatty acid desaturase
MSIDHPAERTSGYSDLAREIRLAGLLTRRPWFYARLGAALLAAGVAVVVVMVRWSDSWALTLLAPVLAVVSTQFGFLGHDVGHRQVARSTRTSRALGVVCGNLLAGLSYAWWVTKHNAHHAHPNDLDSDPDVAVGALVFDTGQAERRRGFAAWITRHQAALFLPMLTLEAVNLHISSVREMFRPGVPWRAAESALLGLHVTGYVALLALTLTLPQALTFAAVHKAVQGIYLGVSFAPGHKGMPVLDEEQALDPLLRQVLTSRNLRGSRVLDAALGGLNYQIEHHLFPSMPRPNLRRAQPLVREFCLRRGVAYTEVPPLVSYRIGLQHLHDVGETLRSRYSGAF